MLLFLLFLDSAPQKIDKLRNLYSKLSEFSPSWLAGLILPSSGSRELPLDHDLSCTCDNCCKNRDLLGDLRTWRFQQNTLFILLASLSCWEEEFFFTLVKILSSPRKLKWKFSWNLLSNDIKTLLLWER